MNVRLSIYVLIVTMSPVIVHAQVDKGQIGKLEARLYHLAQQRDSFEKGRELEYYHIFNLSYNGALIIDSFRKQLTNPASLLPTFISVGTEKFINAESLIAEGDGRLAGGNAGMVIFFDQYSKAYRGSKLELLGFIRQQRFRLLYRLSVAGTYPLDIIWGDTGNGIKVIISETDGHYRIMDQETFLKCCLLAHYPQFKTN